MRVFFKKTGLLLVLAFWSYTWHAYAVGSLDQKSVSPESQETVLKQPLAVSGSLGSIQKKTQFKRRPFITKAAADILEPFQWIGVFPSAESRIPERDSVFQASPERGPLLRAPPILA